MEAKVISVTKPPKHHFFGFHDLPAWNNKGDKILSLEVEVINRPPFPLELAGLGYVNQEGRFFRLGSTSAFNFPQGARSQWVGETNQFIVNNIRENKWACDVYDTITNKIVSSYPFACHNLNKNGDLAYSINYARLFRLGAYGYPGIEDSTRFDSLPGNDGIWVGDLNSSRKELLVSIKAVADVPEKSASRSFGHHYLTHLLLNPSNKRLAFLHRYPLPDGGELTRLMTIGIDGNDIRCLATGYLSHFDWKDDNTIFIFGRVNSNLESLRSNRLLALPYISMFSKAGKKIVKALIKQQISAKTGFILVKDSGDNTYNKIADGVLTEDGHPMFCPLNRDWIITDTYPDKDGIRNLMLYNFPMNKQIGLGHFKMITEKPDLSDSEKYFSGVDTKILKGIQEKNLAFTRSGLHCDLHPRWDMHGTKIAFDSIHEGSRQIYMIDIETKKLL
ncbi:MAG TPA: hypothetical protein DDW27_17260 [Bacteroidales bacterium]|nr:hypothetical protein [Bacteroidales bacterium]